VKHAGVGYEIYGETQGSLSINSNCEGMADQVASAVANFGSFQGQVHRKIVDKKAVSYF
jgi:hypothetical protein